MAPFDGTLPALRTTPLPQTHPAAMTRIGFPIHLDAVFCDVLPAEEWDRVVGLVMQAGGQSREVVEARLPSHVTLAFRVSPIEGAHEGEEPGWAAECHGATFAGHRVLLHPDVVLSRAAHVEALAEKDAAERDPREQAYRARVDLFG
jgi:hypothetical protein